MELACNRRFSLITGVAKQSRLQCLKNGVPQGSVLAPFLFNICTYDLPVTIGRKVVLRVIWPSCILHATSRHCSRSDFYSGYGNPILLFLQLEAKAQYNKTLSAAFHCYKETRREFNIFVNGQAVTFYAKLTFLA